jgi:hypothetical protein
MKKVVFLFALWVTVSVLLSSCGTPQVGKMQRESKSVDPKNWFRC